MKQKLLKVSLVGRTNAGKSTLLNSLVGETVSITNKKINTTEDVIGGIYNQDNHQIIIYDTPGINFLKISNKKNIKLKKNLWEGINHSDLILYIIDSASFNLNEIISNIKKLKELNIKISIVFNKNDLVEIKKILLNIKKIKDLIKIDKFFNISSKKKLGFNNLKNYLIKNTYQNNWIYDINDISDKDELFITNECTRNALLSVVHKEIPYNIKIINKLYKFLKNGDLKIKQEIEIDNPRYKKILLGKDGKKIKDIRVKSQYQISKLLETKVHLYISIVNLNAKKI